MNEENKIEETEEVKEINPVDEYLNNYKEQKLAEFCVNKDKEISDLIDKAIGQYYDLETIGRCADLGYMSMSPHDLRQFVPRKYKNVRLMNINGLATGQLHFITEDGHYLLIPWCYVISMTPSKEK